MDKLLNLADYKKQLSYKISQSDLSDYELPIEFKNAFKSFGEYKVEEYYKYTIKVSSRKSVCYIPNQWIYIAAICSEYCIELKKYKQKLKSLGITDDDFEACHPSSSDKTVTDEQRSDDYVSQKAKELLSSYTGEDKDLLISFLWDYDSWGGGKNIKRENDFTISPCLNVANSINSSSSLIGDIAKSIGDNPSLFDSIINSPQMAKILKGKIETKNPLVRVKTAAGFIREAMKETLSRDKDFSLLERTGKYNATGKNLLINGYWLGRDKSQMPSRESDVYKDVEWTYGNKKYVLNLEMTPDALKNDFFPVFNDVYKNSLYMEKDADSGDFVLYEINGSIDSAKLYTANQPLQQIFYGAPGTGKSYAVNKKVKDILSGMSEEEREKHKFRTTFHPDSDYSSFVGCYKPKEKESKITYSFVPQTFTNAYVAAWNDLDNPYFLIIEEINRGNCAQVFGDLFQLLDRKKDGTSDYTIKADNDLCDYLEENLTNKDGIKNGELCLPPNLYIWATMNTSDQSLFPMDSAFKRRWAWEYVPIDYDNVDSSKFTITIGKDANKKTYSWPNFLRKINEEIKQKTDSEDKQMGNFFIKQSIDEKEFKDKVMFYIWSEVGKDNYNTNQDVFKYNDSEKEVKFSFNELFGPEEEVEKKLNGFLKRLDDNYSMEGKYPIEKVESKDETPKLELENEK
jgi:hypothetical protein